MTADAHGRLFANDQYGPLYGISADGSTVTEFLDLRDYPELGLVAGGERGFQGFAFHPDFHEEGRAGFGRFYTIHSSSSESRSPDFSAGGDIGLHTVLLEWRTDSPKMIPFDPADEAAPFRELLRLNQPYSNHNAGNVAFHPLARPGDVDYGNLYVAIGDSGGGGDPLENGENPGNPYGAILRIQPLGSDSANGRYGIVASNALAADGLSTTLGEVYAFGLRNPQRFGWDVATGDLFIADIGQNSMEELNRAVNGGDFGWDFREGSFSFEGTRLPQHINPVAEYDRVNMVLSMPTGISNRAITMGEVARGSLVTGLDGHVLVSDFPTGLLFVLNVDEDPLDGGQDGWRELRTHVVEGDAVREVRMLTLINETRSARGLSTTTRADIRLSLNTNGRLFITNKRDGIIRRMVPDRAPVLAVGDASGATHLISEGRLEWSEDLQNWIEVSPQPILGESQPIELGGSESGFFRVRNDG